MKKVLLYLLLLFTMAQYSKLLAASSSLHTTMTRSKVLLPAGTLVIFETNGNIRKEKVMVGQIVELRVTTNVVVGDQTVIRAGALGTGRVVSVEKETYNTPGSITIEAMSVQAVDGQIIAITGPHYSAEEIYVGALMTGNVLNNEEINGKVRTANLGSQKIILRAGTPISLQSLNTRDAKDLSTGNAFDLQVSRDVVVNGKIVVKVGAYGIGMVQKIEKNCITFSAESVQAIDGQMIMLRSIPHVICSNEVKDFGFRLTARIRNDVSVIGNFEDFGTEISEEPVLPKNPALTHPIIPIFDSIVSKSSPSGRELPIKRLALVIGNQNYLHAKSLDNPIHDAQAMRQSLYKLGFEVIYHENLETIELLDAINQFKDSLTRYETGLFYYSGHGMEFNGNNYLIPVDAVLKEDYHATKECIALDDVLDALNSDIKILILDACRDNPFSKNWKRREVKPAGGLASPNTDKKGVIVAFATAPGATADDRHPAKQNGLFTGVLVDCLNAPCVAFPDAFFCATEEVGKLSKQAPYISASISRRYYLRCQ